jgi:hypothetical protein
MKPYYAFYDRPVLHCQELLEALDRVLRKLYAGQCPPA